MQRCLASLQPSESVSENDRRRYRNRPGQERTATQANWYDRPAKGLIGAASRQGERRPRSPHWSLPSFRPFFLPSSPRPVHMVIIIIPPPSFRPSGASRHALHPPPTIQDGQATAWFARRLFCWFVRCHCHFPFEVPDSTLPDLDSTSTSTSTSTSSSICSDPYLTLPALT